MAMQLICAVVISIPSWQRAIPGKYYSTACAVRCCSAPTRSVRCQIGSNGCQKRFSWFQGRIGSSTGCPILGAFLFLRLGVGSHNSRLVRVLQSFWTWPFCFHWHLHPRLLFKRRTGQPYFIASTHQHERRPVVGVCEGGRSLQGVRTETPAPLAGAWLDLAQH